MKVFLTFDIEVWCNGWNDMDSRFPHCFERYVYGSTRKGDYALPKTLEILQKHGIKATFFVEPLFSERFGHVYLERIVTLLREAGQDVQLHLHTEWVNEITPPILENSRVKRQHIYQYTLDEQTTLIGRGIRLLEAAGAPRPKAFRAGGFAFDRNTLLALIANDIYLDSSFNISYANSGAEFHQQGIMMNFLGEHALYEYPISNFTDGLGRLRHAQVGACSTSEIREIAARAHGQKNEQLVIVSHNFEMLTPGLNGRDSIVARRFDNLCRHFGANQDRYECAVFSDEDPSGVPPVFTPLLDARASRYATIRRFGEQALRRALYRN